VFVIDGADGVGVGFGDHEHHRSIGTRAVDGKRGVNGTSSWGGEVNSYLVTLCISPVALLAGRAETTGLPDTTAHF